MSLTYKKLLLGGDLGSQLEFLLRDEFVSPLAAGAINGTLAEPGPGTRAVADPDSRVTIANGAIVGAAGGIGTYNTYIGYGALNAIANTPGLALMVNRSIGAATRGDVLISTTDAVNLYPRFELSNGNLSIRDIDSTLISGSTELSNAIFSTIRNNGGGVVYIRNELVLWVGEPVASTLYAHLSWPTSSSAAVFSYIRLAQLGVPWSSDRGVATFYDATPTANDLATGLPDALHYFTWTVTAAETLSIYFRRTDDDNTYRLDCDQAGGTIKLYRRESASDTELDAGKTQTWTASSSYRIGIVYDGGVIKTYVDGTLKHSVSGETYNLTVTGNKVTGFAAATGWELWPRDLSGAALSMLNNYTAPKA